jgi:hypothetical protein
MIPTYLSSNTTKPTKTTKIPKNWGNSINDFIDTDTSAQFIRNLSKTTNKNYLVTDSILPDDFHLSMILKTYEMCHGTYELDGTYERVYTPVNAPSKIIPNSSHQNWICVDFRSKRLVRFEPGEEMEEFGIEVMCNKIVKGMSNISNITYSGPEKNGLWCNPFDGCRLMSTILASMHVMDNTHIILSNLSTDKLIGFAYLAQKEIVEFTPFVNVSKRMTRSQHKL